MVVGVAGFSEGNMKLLNVVVDEAPYIGGDGFAYLIGVGVGGFA